MGSDKPVPRLSNRTTVENAAIWRIKDRYAGVLPLDLEMRNQARDDDNRWLRVHHGGRGVMAHCAVIAREYGLPALVVRRARDLAHSGGAVEPRERKRGDRQTRGRRVCGRR